MNQQSRKLQVALLEHIDHHDIEQFFSSLFEELGYDAFFYRLPLSNIAEPNSDDSLLGESGSPPETPTSWADVRDADELLRTRPIDVFISDVSHGLKQNFNGLEVCRAQKRDYPDTVVIAISRHDLSYAIAASRLPCFDLFIDKKKMFTTDDLYRAEIIKRLRIYLRRNTSAWLDVSESNIGALASNGDQCLLERLLRQTTFTAHGAEPESQVHRVVLEPLHGGYSSSATFRMQSFTANELPCIQAVLKVSRREKAEEEARNYNSFARWYLPYTWRPELIGTGVAGNYAAVCYAFAYNGEVNFKTLDSFISDRDNRQIDGVVEKIFNPGSKRWYDSKNVGIADEDLTTHYAEKWKLDALTESDDRLRKSLNGYTFEDRQIVVGNHCYEHPRDFLLGRKRKKYYECIQHGDLHGGNILVTELGDVSFIDFQHTGYGHVFEDFVFLESGIRRLYKWATPVEMCIQNEYKMTQEILAGTASKSDLPYADLVHKIRKYAYANFPNEQKWTYLYALCLCSFRMLQYCESEWQINQLVGCLLANIRTLSQLER